jgi:serine/threonine protein phosphatase PrpC
MLRRLAQSGMEDAHTAELQLDEDNRTKNAFFAVYDGHGGTSSTVIVWLVHDPYYPRFVIPW